MSHSKTSGSNLIGNKIANKIKGSSKKSPQNNLEKSDEIHSSIYISRIKTKNYWWSKINGRLI